MIRPFGGWLADKLGGANVTLWNFVVMAMAVIGVIYFLPGAGSSGQLPRLPDLVHCAVSDHEHRQRLDIQHDTGDFPD
jgi:nitrate/nitrite transporter NarK